MELRRQTAKLFSFGGWDATIKCNFFLNFFFLHTWSIAHTWLPTLCFSFIILANFSACGWWKWRNRSGNFSYEIECWHKPSVSMWHHHAFSFQIHFAHIRAYAHKRTNFSIALINFDSILHIQTQSIYAILHVYRCFGCLNSFDNSSKMFALPSFQLNRFFHHICWTICCQHTHTKSQKTLHLHRP